MPKLQVLIKKMWDDIQEQKKNISQFYLSSQATATDIYKLNSYTEYLERNLQILTGLFQERSKISPQNAKECVRNASNITIQAGIIKATLQAINEELNKLKQQGDIQSRISGKMISLKKEISYALEKAEKI